MRVFLYQNRKAIVEIIGISYKEVYMKGEDRLKYLRVVAQAKEDIAPILQSITTKTEVNYKFLKSMGTWTHEYIEASDEIALSCIKMLGYYIETIEVLMRVHTGTLMHKLYIAWKLLLAKFWMDRIKEYEMIESTEILFLSLQCQLTTMETKLIRLQSPLGIMFHF